MGEQFVQWPANIKPRGKGVQIRLKHGGKEYSTQIECNPYNPRDIKAAIAERDRIKAALKLGINPFKDAEEGLGNVFAQDAQGYLDQLTSEYSTALDYENIINRFWMPVFHKMPTSAITTHQIKKRLAEFDAITWKRKSNALIPLRGIFEFAGVNPNPGHFKIPKHQRKRIERFRPDERDLILSHLDGQFRVYFALLFGCGLRPGGEPLALKWCDYNNDSLHIYKTIVRRRLKNTTKTHEQRVVIVPKWVQSILNRHETRFQGEWVFVNSLGRWHVDPDRFNEAWREVFTKPAIVRAGIRYRIPYVCRHTRAAEMLSMGIDPARAATQLGHSLEMFYRTYSEFIEEYANQGDREKLLGIGGQKADKTKTIL
ncbi:MAG: tyrosine-type recombinase/integrase [Pontibacterium sp.]